MKVTLDSGSKIKYSVVTSANLKANQLVAVRLKSFSINGVIGEQIVKVPPPASARSSNNAPNLRSVQTDLDNLDGTIVLSLAGLAGKAQPTTLSWATDDNGQLKSANKLTGALVFFGQIKDFLDIQLYVVNSKAKDRANLDTASSVLTGLAGVAGLVPGPGTIASAGLTILSAIVSAISKSAADSYELYYEGTRSLTSGAPFQPNGVFQIARVPKDKADLVLEFDVVPFPDPPTPDKAITVYLESLELDSLSDNVTQVVLHATFGSSPSQPPFALTLNLNQGRLDPSLYVAIDNKFLYQGPKGLGVPFSVDIAINLTVEDTKLGPLSDDVNALAKAAALPKDQLANVSQATKALQSSVALAMAFLPSSKQVGTAAGMILSDAQYKALPGSPSGFISSVTNQSNALESFATIPLKSDNGAAGNLVLRIVESVTAVAVPPPKPAGT